MSLYKDLQSYNIRRFKQKDARSKIYKDRDIWILRARNGGRVLGNIEYDHLFCVILGRNKDLSEKLNEDRYFVAIAYRYSDQYHGVFKYSDIESYRLELRKDAQLHTVRIRGLSRTVQKACVMIDNQRVYLHIVNKYTSNDESKRDFFLTPDEVKNSVPNLNRQGYVVYGQDVQKHGVKLVMLIKYGTYNTNIKNNMLTRAITVLLVNGVRKEVLYDLIGDKLHRYIDISNLALMYLLDNAFVYVPLKMLNYFKAEDADIKVRNTIRKYQITNKGQEISDAVRYPVCLALDLKVYTVEIQLITMTKMINRSKNLMEVSVHFIYDNFNMFDLGRFLFDRLSTTYNVEFKIARLSIVGNKNIPLKSMHMAVDGKPVEALPTENLMLLQLDKQHKIKLGSNRDIEYEDSTVKQLCKYLLSRMKEDVYDTTNTYIMDYSNKLELHIPDVTYIGKYALSRLGVYTLKDCDNLEVILSGAFFELALLKFPVSLKLRKIGLRAFKDCIMKDNYVELPDTLEELGSEAFYGCRIGCLVVKSTKVRINPYAFYGAKIENLVIPKQLVTQQLALNILHLTNVVLT